MLSDKDDRHIVCAAFFWDRCCGGLLVSSRHSCLQDDGVVTRTLSRSPTGLDFTLASHRLRAPRPIRGQCPLLIIGSPTCTMLSALQQLNVAKHGPDPEWRRRFGGGLDEARSHIRSCCMLYRMHIVTGRSWLHELPRSVRSWIMPWIKKLLKDHRVLRVQAHQCRFGLVLPLRDGTDAVGPAKKPTGFMSNSACIIEALNKQCGHDHARVIMIGGRAAGAAIYVLPTRHLRGGVQWLAGPDEARRQLHDAVHIHVGKLCC